MSKRKVVKKAGYFFNNWSLPRQLRGEDPLGSAAQTERSRNLRPRLEEADRVGTSICPYCAVGCAQLIYAKGDRVIHIEGDPRSPINQGTLCPKGAATIGWMMNPDRLTTVKYRPPYVTKWEERPLDWAMDRIAFLIKRTRDETFVRKLPNGQTVNHTMAMAELGGATLDNEENYLIKKHPYTTAADRRRVRRIADGSHRAHVPQSVQVGRRIGRSPQDNGLHLAQHSHSFRPSTYG